MAVRDAWYQHLPAATALIPCEGSQHRVTWRWGKLKLEDHDLGSERAMLVLGGQPCPCLQTLRFWADQFGIRPELFDEMRQRLGVNRILVPPELDIPREVGMTLSLERAWRRSRYLDRQGRLIERRLKDRALPALRAHLNAEKQRFGSRVIRTVELRHVPAGQRPPELRGRMDSVSVTATVALSSDWIVNVWARGLAQVDGAFVLEVTGPGSGPGAVGVRAARWEQRQPGLAEPVAVGGEAVPGEDGWRFVPADPK